MLKEIKTNVANAIAHLFVVIVIRPIYETLLNCYCLHMGLGTFKDMEVTYVLDKICKSARYAMNLVDHVPPVINAVKSIPERVI